MTVMMVDDGWVRTHDEMRELLRYTAIGATVVIERIEVEHAPDARRFTVVLDAAPDFATSCAEIYSLPCLAEPMQLRLRNLCERAWEALRRHRRQ